MTEDAAAPVKVRLNTDASCLDILLPAGALPMPTDRLLILIEARCVELGIDLSLTERELEARMRSCIYGSWLTVVEATAPGPIVDGRVEVLVPIPSERHRARGALCSVRAGTPLARLHKGTPGRPGRNLAGAPLPPPRPPREAHLPRGDNTAIDETGTLLLAAVDGEAVLRHLHIHVLPMRIHEGDLDRDDGPLYCDTAVVIRARCARADVSRPRATFTCGATSTRPASRARRDASRWRGK